MAPGDDGDGSGEVSDSSRPAYVYCPECGTKASADWSFCRRCEASLDDAEPADDRLIVRHDGEDVAPSEAVGGGTGCPKCGHTDAEVDDTATTGNGLSRLFDVQNRRFRAVTCAKCGYTEFYRGRSPDEIVDLFIG